MSFPSGDLVGTFKAFCADFDDAKNIGNYNAIKKYLYNPVTMQYVDDPGTRTGSPQDIVNYLNTDQAQSANWPQFDPDSGQINPCKRHRIGNVTGPGTYQDSQDVAAIPVSYSFRFKQDANGNWLIAFASATPTG
jgi:hypothetical protein